MYNASKNSNWDQLQQVSRTQKLEITALTKCCLLLISVVEVSEAIHVLNWVNTVFPFGYR